MTGRGGFLHLWQEHAMSIRFPGLQAPKMGVTSQYLCFLRKYCSASTSSSHTATSCAC